MKKIIIYLGLSFMTSMALANSIVLDNKTNYPKKEGSSKIAVQWAISAKAVQKANKEMEYSYNLKIYFC